MNQQIIHHEQLEAGLFEFDQNTSAQLNTESLIDQRIDDVLAEYETLSASVQPTLERDIGATMFKTIESKARKDRYEPIFGSARAYLEAEGKPEQAERYQYVLNDARTQIFELLTVSGHVSVVKSDWDDELEMFVAYGGMSTIEMYENSLNVGGLPRHEMLRRRAELDEEHMVHEIYQNGWFEGKALLTISAYPDAIDDYTADKIGYRPQSKKYMLRWHEPDSSGKRDIVQLSMSGSDLKVLNQVYTKLGYPLDEQIDDVGMLGMPILVDKSDVADVTEIARMIDEMKGGQNFGEDGGPKADYDNIFEISLEREERAKIEIDNFARQWIEIERTIIDGRDKILAWQAAIKTTMGTIVMDQPEFIDSVGEEAKDHLRQAMAYRDAGDMQSAWDMLGRSITVMKIGGACGGLGEYEDNELSDLDTLLNPFSSKKNKSKDESDNSEKKFKTNCPHCKQKNVTATIKNCKISCSNDDCTASKGVELK